MPEVGFTKSVISDGLQLENLKIHSLVNILTLSLDLNFGLDITLLHNTKGN